MILRWFLSRTVRQATSMHRHVRKLLKAQRDILSPQAIEAVSAGIEDLRQAVAGGADKATLNRQMEKLVRVADKQLKPYPNPVWRENVEVVLVALVVAMGIRTFFLQPFKIPTGSMQPTLYGITHENLLGHPEMNIPNRLARLYQFWVHGTSWKHVVAEATGVVESYEPLPKKFLLFNLTQRFRVGGVTYTVWFPPEKFLERAGLTDAARDHRVFQRGEDIVKLKVHSGDHLFVDRLTYNFRPPKRGEIIVFLTKTIEALPQDQFYIKRLVALGDEQVRVGNDRHLVIDAMRLDASTPHFENVYGFNPKQPPAESTYSGHVNQFVANQHRLGDLAPLFPDGNALYPMPPRHYMVMGDNTVNSSDSRRWGAFPESNVIGKAWFVYWPITRRFGWGYW